MKHNNNYFTAIDEIHFVSMKWIHTHAKKRKK
jgi:hypothetical protein